MSSGFDSSMNHKYEMPKTDRLQGAPAAESLKSIAQLNPASFGTKAAIRYPVAAMQVIGTLPGTAAAPTLPAPLLPKIAANSGPLPLQPSSATVPNPTERGQLLQPVSSVPSAAAAAAAAATAAAAAPAVVASSFSGQPAQPSAVSIIRPATPMHATSTVANLFGSGGPRVVTTDTKKTITAPPTRPVVLPHVAFPRISAPLPGLTATPVVPQLSATLPAVALPAAATGSPQLLLSSQHSAVVQPGSGLRNLSQHSIRPGTPPAPGKLPVSPALGAGSTERLPADHHRFNAASGQTVGTISNAVGITVPVTSMPPATTSSTVQITIHQPKAATSAAATVVADRLSFARLPPTAPPTAANLAAVHAQRPIIPQNSSSSTAALLSVAQPPIVTTVPRAVPVISTPGNTISIPMVVTTAPAAAAARPAAQQRSAGQHDYSRHEPGTSSMPTYDSLSKPLVGALVPAASTQASTDGFSGRIVSGGNASGSSLPSNATTVATTMMPTFLSQEQLYAATSAQPQLAPLGIINATQPQFGSTYLRGGQYRTTIYPSPQPSMSTIVSSSTTRTALLLPAMNARPLPATTVHYGQAGQNGADDVTPHGLSAVGSVIVSNTAVGLQQTSANTPGGVGSSSPRPSILRKRAAVEGGSSSNTSSGARRVLPMIEPVSLGSSSAAAKITDAANMHIRAESPKLLLPLAGSSSERAPASRRSSTDTATDPGLSIDSPSPTSVKQEPMDLLENGLPVLPAYTASADVSPRKKPRKQLLNMVNDYKEEDYSTEEETETKGLHPICQLRQPHLRDASKHDRQAPAATMSAVEVRASSSSASTKPQLKRPLPGSGAGVDEDRTSWVPIKRPRMQMLDGYKRAYPWKSQNNHFQRYADVKAKEESRLTVSELSNKRGVNKCASGWRLFHIAARFDEVSQAENDLHDRLHEMQRMLTSTSFQQRGSGRHSLDTGVAADVSRVNELAQACKQRCILIQSQLKDAREAMLMILKHKAVIMDIISKHHCRRTVKKKERT